MTPACSQAAETLESRLASPVPFLFLLFSLCRSSVLQSRREHCGAAIPSLVGRQQSSPVAPLHQLVSLAVDWISVPLLQAHTRALPRASLSPGAALRRPCLHLFSNLPVPGLQPAAAAAGRAGGRGPGGTGRGWGPALGLTGPGGNNPHSSSSLSLAG